VEALVGPYFRLARRNLGDRAERGECKKAQEPSD
jgi:hypothetical protein